MPRAAQSWPFLLSKQNLCVYRLDEQCRAHLFGEWISKPVFVPKIDFHLSCCPRGSGRERDVLLLFYVREGHFLRNQKNVYMPAKYQRLPTAASLWSKISGGIRCPHITQSFILAWSCSSSMPGYYSMESEGVSARPCFLFPVKFTTAVLKASELGAEG